jgi:hypothetical protein
VATRHTDKAIRQNETAEPDRQERDMLVKGLPSACVTVTDDEEANEQQEGYSREGERAELSTEWKR